MDALTGLEQLVGEVIADMEEQGERVPDPFSERRFSGKFDLRVGEKLHGRLAMRPPKSAPASTPTSCET